MTDTTSAIKVLLVSVGGSPAPVIRSINEQRPEYVIFFCSKSTRAVAHNEIRCNLSVQLKDSEVITTDDEQDLVPSCQALYQNLPRVLKLWESGFADLVGDITGGTKVMSAAVALVLAGMGCRFSYVGGASRSKDGLGQVLDGAEELRIIQDPLDALLVQRLTHMETLFNSRQYLAMGALAAEVSRSTSPKAPFFRGMEDVAAGYYHWDNFSYRTAKQKLAAARNTLKSQGGLGCQGVIFSFLSRLEANLAFLDQVLSEFTLLHGNTIPATQETPPDTPPALVQDLVANAIRCAEQGERYDDAVIRLYSAVEKLAKLRLLLAHGLDNSNMDPDTVPDQRVKDFLACSCREETPPYKLPLQRSYALLTALGDPLGEAFTQHEGELRQLQNLRNESILAHGLNPLGEEKYTRMLKISLAFLNMQPQSLPGFPHMAWKGLGY